MHENNNKQELGSSSTDKENSFTVTLESINSAFGISADGSVALLSAKRIFPGQTWPRLMLDEPVPPAHRIGRQLT